MPKCGIEMQYAMWCAEFVVCVLAFCSILGSLFKFLLLYRSFMVWLMYGWMCVCVSYPFQLSLLREMELLALHLHKMYPFCRALKNTHAHTDKYNGTAYTIVTQ